MGILTGLILGKFLFGGAKVENHYHIYRPTHIDDIPPPRHLTDLTDKEIHTIDENGAVSIYSGPKDHLVDITSI